MTSIWGPPRTWRPVRRSRGFTLAELLIVATLGMVLMAAVVFLVVSYTRSRERIEALSRLQDHWSRAQFLLDQEIQESRASTFTAITVPSGCLSAASTAANAVLALTNSDFSSPILYYRSGTDLRRCGPAVNASGQLISTVADQLVLRNVSAISVDLTDSERPRYTLTLSDASGYTYTNQSQPSGSISRVRPIQ